jgi:ankyrin repeat protein
LLTPAPAIAAPQDELNVPPAVRALFEAVSKGSADGVARALKAGADINFEAPFGGTPLMFAVHGHHVEIVRVLLKAGARVNHAATDGTTALIVAASAGHADLIAPLVDAGAAIDARDKEGRTALMHAASGGFHSQAEEAYAAVVKALLASRAAVQLQAADGRTALAIAADEDFRQIVALLKAAGAVDVPLPAQAFLDAIVRGSTADVRAMLKDTALANASLATRDEMTRTRRLTALQLAATRGHLDIVKALVDAGADVNARSEGGTALTHAAEWTPAERKEEVVALLLRAGADLKATDSGTWTAVHRAARSGSTGAVRALVAAGADINSVAMTDGDTPLTIAAIHGHSALVADLIKAGANVNIQNLNKRTALMHAAASGDVASVRALIQAGADVNAVENNGGTALAWAKGRGHQEIVDMLVKAGARK